METMSGVDIRKVAELFRQTEAPSDSEEEDQTNITPANIGPSKRIPSKNNKPKLETDIWDCEALPVGQVCPSDDSDPRIQPEYEIVYKQKVASEDIFLQNVPAGDLFQLSGHYDGHVLVSYLWRIFCFQELRKQTNG